MNQIYKQSLNNIFKTTKLTSRYQNLSYRPSPIPKPMNPMDNLDPTKQDNTMVDEYDTINRNFSAGDQAPLAWKARREFPADYKPYLTNYHGHGFLMCFVAFWSLSKYIF